jgi:hypothetical protein
MDLLLPSLLSERRNKMKKFMSLALVASCLATPLSLSAQEPGTAPGTTGFKNRGECESTLAKMRNNFRKNPELRELAGLSGTGDLSNKEFNEFAREDFECREDKATGTFFINFIPDD